MTNYKNHLIKEDATVPSALIKLDKLVPSAILFVINEEGQLLGSLTDGDIRRGLIKGLKLSNKILDYAHQSPRFFSKDQFSLGLMQDYRKKQFKILPVVDEQHKITDIVNFIYQKAFLPIDAIIMAGGKGTRLRPLTLNTPKPLLKIGDKPIIEYNVDRLRSYGITNLHITINYLGDQLKTYFGNGEERGMDIQYVEETEPLGTIGSVSLIEHFHNDYILVMNSDLLTNIDYEKLFEKLVVEEGDMILATTPYEVKVPYGVIEIEGDYITNLVEKPTYTYYSNAGIYIIKREHLALIPHNQLFNATDLMEVLIQNNKKVLHYPIIGYWLDIGKPHDYEKAQKDVDHIKF